MMYCKKNIVSRLILLVGTFFWACSSENVSGGNEALDGMINGVSQKGPFLEGSSVTMQELDENSLAQTGKSFKGKVEMTGAIFLLKMWPWIIRMLCLK